MVDCMQIPSHHLSHTSETLQTIHVCKPQKEVHMVYMETLIECLFSKYIESPKVHYWYMHVCNVDVFQKWNNSKNCAITLKFDVE